MQNIPTQKGKGYIPPRPSQSSPSSFLSSSTVFFQMGCRESIFSDIKLYFGITLIPFFLKVSEAVCANRVTISGQAPGL